MLIALCGFFPRSAWPQASVNVSTLDPVYRDIDKLVAHGLVDKIIVGQRPYSRREIARITAEAMNHLSRIQGPLDDANTPASKKEKLRARLNYLQPVLARLQRDYREELVQLGALEGEKSWYSAHPLEKAVVDTTVTNSLPETLSPSNGIGGIDAVINPLVDYREGRHIVDGGNLSLETTHWFRVTDYLAFYARPRFQLAFGREGQPNDNEVFVQNLYGKVRVKNFEIEVGRDNLVWGQGLNAGLLLSNNPRGLDMIKIGNDEPFFFPWVFKYIGAHKISFFYSDQGPEQNFPHSYLAGWKWSLQPLSFFELGASLVLDSGGQGSPQAPFGERVADLIPLVDFFFVTDRDFQISNKLAGFDARFRIPPARGMELYAEAIIDDYDSSRLKSIFWEDAGYVFGLYMPRLVNSGAVDLRLEYHHTGLRFYRHGQFTSGWTLNQFIMGDNLGPDANGLYLNVNWDINRSNLLAFDAAFERRSNDQYTTVQDPTFRFVKTQSFPEENRYRGVVSWRHRVENFPMQILAQVGMERVQNFTFVSGLDRNNYMGRLNLQLDLDRWTRQP